MKVKISEEFRQLISRSPNILGVRFLASNPIEFLSKDYRWANHDQVLLTREQILALIPEPQEKL